MMKLALRRTAASRATRWQRVCCWLIKARLVSQYCHGGIVIGDRLFHATATAGLQCTDYEPHKWDVFDLPGQDPQAALALFARHQGAAYDWFSLLAFVLPLKVDKAERFYCFEWCAHVMSLPIEARCTPEKLLRRALQLGARSP